MLRCDLHLEMFNAVTYLHNLTPPDVGGCGNF